MLYGQKKTKLSRLNLLIESYLPYKLVLVQHVGVVVSGGGMVVVVVWWWWYGGGGMVVVVWWWRYGGGGGMVRLGMKNTN